MKPLKCFLGLHNYKFTHFETGARWLIRFWRCKQCGKIHHKQNGKELMTFLDAIKSDKQN